jgi:hypothetical protein
MRFWVKVPSSIQVEPAGQANIQIGTYVRSSTGDPASAESGGNHYYHHFNIPYTGQWHQVILDTHPNHERGGDGSTEWGNKLYPTGESAFNYFDALTRFYFDVQGSLTSNPSNFYFDNFELYKEPNAENVNQIYSLNGVYTPSTNEVYIGWMRNKNENSVNHEVRYAFSDIFASGWSAATPAPNGIVSPPGWQGYNGMEWKSRALSLSGRSGVYIGIKPQNSSSFRQILIPLPASSTLVAPRNLRIVP